MVGFALTPRGSVCSFIARPWLRYSHFASVLNVK